MDHISSARRPDLVIVNNNKKENLPNSGLYHRIKLKEGGKRDEYLDLARELKKNYGTWKWQWYQL